MCDQAVTGVGQPISETTIDVERSVNNNNSAGLIVAVISIILITIVLAVIIYYNRRVKRLKRELAVVQYTANPQTTGTMIAQVAEIDQHHFDNPVYAYQSVSKSHPNLLENGNLNNGMTIKNNLSIKDDKNREWEKLGTFTFDDDGASSLGAVGGHYDVPSIRTKSMEADATNPNLNIYHSIESLKDNRLVEHVYDEIKQHPSHPKDPESEYDHLTYSRPVGDVKPHYYRMATALRRSADQLATQEDGATSQPPPPPTKRRYSSNSSTSSNELNSTKPEQENGFAAFVKENEFAFNENGFTGLSNGENISKVSNLNAEASDDAYARLKVNNLDVSLDSGKRDAYDKFEDDFNVTSTTLLNLDDSISHGSNAESAALSPDEN